MNQFDRLWRTRDAVLAWLGSEIASGRRDANASADIVMNATAWSEAPLSEQEVNDATVWLKNDGFIRGQGTWGHGVIRMSLEAKGERYLSEGRSVRDEQTQAPYVVNSHNTITVTGNQGSAVAVDSAYAQQAVTNTDSFQLVREVANLVRTASAGTDQQDEGRVLAAQIEAELAGDAESSPGKLKQLMFTAATAFAGALGSVGGTDLAQLAMQAYTML